MRDSDVLFLDAAIALAERGMFTTTPNPRVGCVLVRDGRVIGRGWHQHAGGPHAEAAALAAATQSVAGATCFVSLEPCAHSGRTPPCADALIAARVARVVIGSRDPNPSVAGRGIARMRAAGIEVNVAERGAALELNRGFFTRFTQRRPWVRLKIAASLDGRTAMASGESQWITGAAARADVQHWRARSCAVLTGIGTLLADDPQLTVRDARYAVDGVIRQPLRVILDSALRTPAHRPHPPQPWPDPHRGGAKGARHRMPHRGGAVCHIGAAGGFEGNARRACAARCQRSAGGGRS